MKYNINYPAIISFYSIAIFLRYISNVSGLLTGVSNEILMVLLQGIGPAVGALFVFCVFKIKPALSLKGNYKYILYPLTLFWIFPILLIVAIQFLLQGKVPILPAVAILTYGLFEEIGWRSFLRKQLQPLPSALNMLIVSSMWFVWHLNFDLSYTNLLFFGVLILGSWGIGKVADNTNSLLAVASFHSLNNFFTKVGNIELAVLLILLAVWIFFLIRRKKAAVDSVVTVSSN